MARTPEEKAVVDSIIDEGIDAQDLIDAAVKRAPDITKRMMIVAKNVTTMRAKGKLTADRAKALLREAYVLLMKTAHAEQLPSIVKHADAHAEKQIAAVKKFGKPLKQVQAIRDLDAKERANERAGVGKKVDASE